MTKKRRKRTNSHVPAKGRLRDMADRLWSRAIQDDWGKKCAACGSRSQLNSHHLVPRGYAATRYDLQNGICLCAHCHTFSNDISPHLNAAGWLRWLHAYWRGTWDWYTGITARGDHKRFNAQTNAAYYCGVIKFLREYVDAEEFDRIVGMRFSAWLSSEE